MNENEVRTQVALEAIGYVVGCLKHFGAEPALDAFLEAFKERPPNKADFIFPEVYEAVCFWVDHEP